MHVRNEEKWRIQKAQQNEDSRPEGEEDGGEASDTEAARAEEDEVISRQSEESKDEEDKVDGGEGEEEGVEEGKGGQLPEDEQSWYKKNEEVSKGCSMGSSSREEEKEENGWGDQDVIWKTWKTHQSYFLTVQ